METDTKTPRIALIQLHVPAESTTLSQFKRTERFVRQVAVENPDLAILPEIALGLCDPDGLLGHAEACAVELLNFQKLAKVSIRMSLRSQRAEAESRN